MAAEPHLEAVAAAASELSKLAKLCAWLAPPPAAPEQLLARVPPEQRLVGLSDEEFERALAARDAQRRGPQE